MWKVAAVLLATLLMNTGCTAMRRAGPGAASGAAAPTFSGLLDEADMIAQEAVSARVTVLLHLDRLRGFRFSERLMLLGGWAEVLEGTEVDPLSDVRRAFIAAHASQDGQVAVVLQHTAEDVRVARSLDRMQRVWQARTARTAGMARTASLREEAIAKLTERFPDPARLPFPAAYRLLGGDSSGAGGPMLIAAPRPGVLVMLPPEQVSTALRLMEVGGLPAPRAAEAMVFRAWDPGSSIQSGPAWSSDVRYADVVFAFDGEGNTTLAFRAVCTSPAAARVQAVRLTEQVEEAQSLSFGGARLRLFDFIEFHAEHDRVKMRAHLVADEVDWIMAMARKSM